MGKTGHSHPSQPLANHLLETCLMDLVVVGISHSRASVEVREQLAISSSDAIDRLNLPEAVVLSTCNRIEIYAATEQGRVDADSISRFIAGDRADLLPLFYRHQGRDAVRHLLKVASGLRSMVLGETQILGQVKVAYQTAKRLGRTGKILDPLFQHAFFTAKRIHKDHSFGENPVSIASVAARLAEKILRDLRGMTILVIGAGKTGELALRAIRERGADRTLMVNRTLERAQHVVERYGGAAFPLSRLPSLLLEADLVFSCVNSDSFILDEQQVREIQARRTRPHIFLIDLAVPRSIDPGVAGIDNVYLHNIDDLRSLTTKNMEKRRLTAHECNPVIEEETGAILEKIGDGEFAEVASELRARLEEVGARELERTLSRLDGLSPENREEVGLMVHRIVGKILHPSLRTLREEAHLSSTRDLARRFYGVRASQFQE